MQTKRQSLYLIAAFAVFAFVFTFFNSKCSPLYPFNGWFDPNIYFSIGKSVMDGMVLYRDVFDHKGPLIFFIYGVASLIHFTDFTGVYVLQSVCVFFNLLFAYKLAKLYLSQPFAVLTALLYPLLIFSRTENGGSADEFMVPFITASLYLFVRYMHNESRYVSRLGRDMFVQGILFACVFLIKYSAAIFWPPILLAIGVKLLITKRYGDTLRAALSFLAGFAVVAVPVLIYFAVHGALSDFWFSYFTFNTIYNHLDTTGYNIQGLFYRYFRALGYDLISPTFVVTALAVILVGFTKTFITDKLYRWGLILGFAGCYILKSSSYYSLNYAYVIFFPFALFAIIYILKFGERRIKKVPAYVFVLLAVIVLFADVAYKNFFHVDVDCLVRRRGCTYWQQEFADVIGRNSGRTLLDLELDKGVFTAAALVPRYKYFFHPAIQVAVFPDMYYSQIDLIRRRDPDFVITKVPDFPGLQANYNLVLHRNVQGYEGEAGGDIYLFRRK